MSPTAPTLLVLAAGLGSRYGGLKQFEPMGPGGETLLDYSIFDARCAGFDRVVLVVRPDLDTRIKTALLRQFDAQIQLDFVIQDLRDVPDHFRIPAERVKPWGTLHAVLAARHAIHTPFAVINADDYYGPSAYQQLVGFFAQPQSPHGDKHHYCMVGYALDHTLSANGGVNRGLCVKRQGFLAGVEELVGIVSDPHGSCHGFKLNGERINLAHQAVVSMNFWGFTPAIFDQMQGHFFDFLREHGARPGAECYIPSVIDRLVREGQADCRILKTEDHWFGVTYAQDKLQSVSKLQDLVTAGVYPRSLWSHRREDAGKRSLPPESAAHANQNYPPAAAP